MADNERSDKTVEIERNLAKGIPMENNRILKARLDEIKDILNRIKNEKSNSVNACRIEEKRTGESFANSSMTIFFVCLAVAVCIISYIPTLRFLGCVCDLLKWDPPSH